MTRKLASKNKPAITDTALKGFYLYLSGRSFSVGNFVSAALFCGVPQGSVMGPILLVLYMLPLEQIISHCKGISYHYSADDIQLDRFFKPDKPDQLTALHDCLRASEGWMANFLLQLNTYTTKVLIIAPDKMAPKVKQCIGSLYSSVQPSLRNLFVGVIFHQALSFDQHIKLLTRSCLNN